MSLSIQRPLTNERMTGECVKYKLHALLGVHFYALCLNDGWDAVNILGVWLSVLSSNFLSAVKCQYHRINSVKAAHPYLYLQNSERCIKLLLYLQFHHLPPHKIYQTVTRRIFLGDFEIRII